MFKIRYNHYSILDFWGVQNETLKLCLGVIGYLYLSRLNKYQTSYVPSRFIIPFSRKCGCDIQEYLERGGYIIRYIQPQSKQKMIGTIVVNDENYKQEAKIFLVTNKLRTLREIALTNNSITRLIDKNTHHLNNQYFNHYYHSYRHIKVNFPDEIKNSLPTYGKAELLERLSFWGDPTHKHYFPNVFGWDNNEWAGAHINDFKFLRKESFNYTSLGEVVEIALRSSTPTILADLLIKTVGDNDYSDFFKRNKFSAKVIKVKPKPEPRKKKKPKAKEKEVGLNPLFETDSDYDVYREVPYQEFYAAIYGYEQIDSFSKRFPGAWDHLYLIKRGWFEDFAKGVKPLIFKNDIRLFIEKDHPAFKRGQLYYKIVPLVVASTQVKMMRDYWMRLKRCGIRFIPSTECSIVVSKQDERAATYILNKVLYKHIDRRIKAEVGVLELKNVKTQTQLINELVPYESPEELTDILFNPINPKAKPLIKEEELEKLPDFPNSSKTN